MSTLEPGGSERRLRIAQIVARMDVGGVPNHVLALACGLATVLRHDRFDVVHTHTSKAALVGGIAARLVGRTERLYRDVLARPTAT